MIKERKGAFENVTEDIELIGFTSAFASCIQNGNPIGYPCPFARKMKEIVQNDLKDEEIQIIDYTH